MTINDATIILDMYSEGLLPKDDISLALVANACVYLAIEVNK